MHPLSSSSSCIINFDSLLELIFNHSQFSYENTHLPLGDWYIEVIRPHAIHLQLIQ